MKLLPENITVRVMPGTVCFILSLYKFLYSHCMQQIIDGIAYCHRMGIIHRDLKVKLYYNVKILKFDCF